MTPSRANPSFHEASLWLASARMDGQAREALLVIMRFMRWPGPNVSDRDAWSWGHLTVEQLAFMCERKRRTGTRRLRKLRELGLIETELPSQDLGPKRYLMPHVIRLCVDKLEQLSGLGREAFAAFSRAIRDDNRAKRLPSTPAAVVAKAPPTREHVAKEQRRSEALEAAAAAERALGEFAGLTGFSRGRAVEVYSDLGDEGRASFLADVELLAWALQRAPAHSALGEAATKGRRIWSSRTWRRRITEARALREQLEAGAAAYDVITAAVEVPDDFLIRGSPVTSAADAWSKIEGRVGVNFESAGVVEDGALVVFTQVGVLELLHQFPQRPLGLDQLGLALRVRARPPDRP